MFTNPCFSLGIYLTFHFARVFHHDVWIPRSFYRFLAKNGSTTLRTISVKNVKKCYKLKIVHVNKNISEIILDRQAIFTQLSLNTYICEITFWRKAVERQSSFAAILMLSCYSRAETSSWFYGLDPRAQLHTQCAPAVCRTSAI